MPQPSRLSAIQWSSVPRSLPDGAVHEEMSPNVARRASLAPRRHANDACHPVPSAFGRIEKVRLALCSEASSAECAASARIPASMPRCRGRFLFQHSQDCSAPCWIRWRTRWRSTARTSPRTSKARRTRANSIDVPQGVCQHPRSRLSGRLTGTERRIQWKPISMRRRRGTARSVLVALRTGPRNPLPLARSEELRCARGGQEVLTVPCW